MAVRVGGADGSGNVSHPQLLRGDIRLIRLGDNFVNYKVFPFPKLVDGTFGNCLMDQVLPRKLMLPCMNGSCEDEFIEKPIGESSERMSDRS